MYRGPVGPGTAVTDASGRFAIEVEAGAVSLGAFHPEFGSTYQDVNVPLGGLSGISLALEPYDDPWPGGDGGAGGGGGVEPGAPGVAN